MAIDSLTRYNARLLGNPDAGKTIVFVNGLGTDQSAWKGLLPAFAEDFRLLLFDNVGSVESNRNNFQKSPFRYLNANGYALDLLDICSALELDGNTIVVGHSLGAIAALLAASQSPRQVGQLVLIGASPRYQDAESYLGGFSRDAIDAIYSAVRSDYDSWSESLASAAMGNPDRPGLADAFAASLRQIPKDMMLTVLCSLLQADHRDQLARVSAPTLIIQARDDIFVPPQVAEYLHAHIPSSTLRFIDASGHLPHVSAPRQVAAAIRDFLAPAAAG